MKDDLNANAREVKGVKCLVWDLDYTLWDGVLLEGDPVSLREGVKEVIQTLDQRGILHSIASRNEFETAMEQVRQFGLEEYFLYPQIGWEAKSGAIRRIAESLNLGLDSLALIDDQPYERDEVRFSLPEVRCYDAANLGTLVDLPEMIPRFLTADSSQRRRMYQIDQARQQAQDEFAGPQQAFLETLGMTMKIFPVAQGDLERAEELTVRTNQLNTTGRTYSYEQLDDLRTSEEHLLLMASLEDKYGSYGRIGLALVACGERIWTVKLLLMSCRVMSRGVGTAMLLHLMRLAKEAGARLQVEYQPNERNRLMNVTLRLAGFREAGHGQGFVVLEHDLVSIPPFPDYLKIGID